MEVVGYLIAFIIFIVYILLKVISFVLDIIITVIKSPVDYKGNDKNKIELNPSDSGNYCI